METKRHFCTLLFSIKSFLFITILLQTSSKDVLAQKENTLQFNPKFRATYHYRFVPDTTNKARFVTESFYLFFNDTGSVFISSAKFYNDSIISSPETFKKMGTAQNSFSDGFNKLYTQMKRTSNNYVVIKSNIRSTLKFIDEVGIECLYYEEPPEQFKWEFVPSVKNFNEIACNQAKVNFRGRNYSALYNLNVPLRDGPYKFGGLPGLIFQISDDSNEVEFKITDIIQYTSPVNIQFLSPPKAINRKKMRELKMQHYLNPYISAETMGLGLIVSEEQKAKVIESRKRLALQNSNRIEKD